MCDAVRRKDWANLQEELGDVLLQILFHAQMAKEAGRFDINDVLATLKSKLVRRHPHVFGKGRKEKLTPEEVKRRWKILKAREKKMPSSPRERETPLLKKRPFQNHHRN